jgi:glycosyltransferase involved in cell wall biosynthesis/O-antigen/teichoic acid export membrane protein
MNKTLSLTKNTHKKLLKSSISLIVASIIINGLNFLYNAYLGRNLELVEFGLISLLSGIVSIIQIPLGTYARAVTHKSALLFGKYDTPVKKLWKTLRGNIIFYSLVPSFLWVLASPFLAQYFNTSSILPFLILTPIWTVGIYSAVDGGFLSGSHSFGNLAIIGLVEASVKFALTIIFVQMRQEMLVYTAIPLSVLASFFYGWLAASLLKEDREVELTKKDLSRLSKKFIGSSFLIKCSTVLFLSVDVILAKHYLSPEDAGTYALISLVGKMVFFLGGLFSQFINPMVSRNIGAQISSRSVFLIAVPLTAAASLLGYLFFGAFGWYTLPLLLGERVQSILPYTNLYAFSYALITIAIAVVGFHQAHNRHGFAFLSIFGSFLMIISIVLFHGSIGEISTAVSGSGIIFFLFSLLMDERIEEKDEIQKTPKRILIFNWRDTKHAWAGGAEVYVHEIAKQWVKEGKEVILFCGNDGKSTKHDMVDGVCIIRRGGHYTVYLWAVLYYFYSLGKWADIIVESENGCPFFAQLYSNKPVFLLVYHVHQEIFRKHLPFPLSYVAMGIEKFLLPLIYRGGRVITISESTRQDLVKLGLAEIEDIEIVNPGVHLSDYRSLPETLHPTFVYVGRLKHYKNIDIAIRAFKRVLKKYPKALFTIAGDGEELRNLRRLAKRLHVENAVMFLGKVDEYVKAVLLAKAWVAIQPSSVEGWGITVIEANAAGTPVIASKVPGLKDSVVDNVTGVLVEAKNVEMLSNAMISLIRDEEKRRHLAKEAKKWSYNFSWKNAASLFLRSIEERMTI